MLGSHTIAHTLTGANSKHLNLCVAALVFPSLFFFWPPFNGDLYLYLNLKAIWLSPHRSHTPWFAAFANTHLILGLFRLARASATRTLAQKHNRFARSSTQKQPYDRVRLRETPYLFPNVFAFSKIFQAVTLRRINSHQLTEPNWKTAQLTRRP